MSMPSSHRHGALALLPQPAQAESVSPASGVWPPSRGLRVPVEEDGVLGGKQGRRGSVSSREGVRPGAEAPRDCGEKPVYAS